MKSCQKCPRVKEYLYEGPRSLLERNLFYLYEGPEPRPRKGWEEEKRPEEAPGPEEAGKKPRSLEKARRGRGPEAQKRPEEAPGPEKVRKRPGPEKARPGPGGTKLALDKLKPKTFGQNFRSKLRDPNPIQFLSLTCNPSCRQALTIHSNVFEYTPTCPAYPLLNKMTRNLGLDCSPPNARLTYLERTKKQLRESQEALDRTLDAHGLSTKLVTDRLKVKTEVKTQVKTFGQNSGQNFRSKLWSKLSVKTQVKTQGPKPYTNSINPKLYCRNMGLMLWWCHGLW